MCVPLKLGTRHSPSERQLLIAANSNTCSATLHKLLIAANSNTFSATLRKTVLGQASIHCLANGIDAPQQPIATIK